MSEVYILNCISGNICSLINAIEKLGYTVKLVQDPQDLEKAEKLILPGVGHFGHRLKDLRSLGFVPHLQKYFASGKPFMGICVGLQALFDKSEEDMSVEGLGLVPGTLKKFDNSSKSVPHIGWSSATTVSDSNGSAESFYGLDPESRYYYVHSYAVPYVKGQLERIGWTVATARYGTEEFISAVGKDNVFATQFHPEKSGAAGLRVLKSFLEGKQFAPLRNASQAASKPSGLTRRVIACLDVRSNDEGDLVVTKGDQYNVREKNSDGIETGGQVRNLGKPVDMARRYYEQGADEITFLNITAFRSNVFTDQPMLEVLRRTSKHVFVPLTIGGGIHATVDAKGLPVTAVHVAKMYFESGADKVSIGSDSVLAAEAFYERGRKLNGDTSIEQISREYGNQAVVVSVDPKRVYVRSAADTKHSTVHTIHVGPNNEEHCWYQCTINGGRQARDLDVIELTQAVEAMGAGEILLNCMDKDGTKSGFDLELINHVKSAVKIPVIASSGAGTPEHFAEVFEKTTVDAALGAGMFHRGEYTVKQVKDYLKEKDLLVHPAEVALNP